MKKIVFLLFIVVISCSLIGQKYNSFKNNVGYWSFGSGGVKYLTYDDNAKLVSWINYQNLNITSTQLSDLSGNNNNWNLVNSNGMKLNGTAYISLNTAFYIPLYRTYNIDFYASLNQPTWGMICGGTTSTNYITIRNTGVQLVTPRGNILFDGVLVPSDDVIRHYTINIRQDSIRVSNGTVSQTKLNTLNTDSIGVSRIGNRNSSGTLNGWIFGLNFNNEHIWPLAEGHYVRCFDVVTGDFGTIQTSVDSLRRKQNLYHYNLKYGYSVWEDDNKFILMPKKINGDTINYTIQFWDLWRHTSKGQFHNGCETGLQPPISLLPYDYNNYLFTDSVPNVIYYNNMSENIGNIIFMNVSTPYQYKDIQVYNKAVQ